MGNQNGIARGVGICIVSGKPVEVPLSAPNNANYGIFEINCDENTCTHHDCFYNNIKTDINTKKYLHVIYIH